MGRALRLSNESIPGEFTASLPIVVPANLANLASLCIGDFLESIFVSIIPLLPLRVLPPGPAISIVMSQAATDNEHFFPVEPFFVKSKGCNKWFDRIIIT